MRRPVAAVVGLVAFALLGGCLSLPTSGEIAEGRDGPPDDGGLEIVAPGPAEGATPVDLVEGFLLASSFGLGDDFDRATEFLTPASGASWNPLGGVTVYSEAEPPEVTTSAAPAAEGTAQVTVSVEVTATIAPDGTLTEATPGTVQQFELTLIERDGQWRIDELDDGVLMSEVTFGSQYRPIAIYFLSGEREPHLVPDLRWVPRSRAASGSVRALLQGPAEWLSAPAVVSAFPAGTEVGIEGIRIDDQVATIDLDSEFLGASAVDRAYALAQLTATLRQLGQVNTVQISVDGSLLTVDETLSSIARTPAQASRPTVVTGEGLGVVGAGGVVPVDGAGRQPEALTQIAVPYGDGPVVGLLDGETLAAIDVSGTSPTVLLSPGSPLLAPTYDLYGWVWTGTAGPDGDPDGELRAVDPVRGDDVTIAAPELAGVEVVDMRVSHEGRRLVYAVRSESGAAIYVAAIERDIDGRPVAISAGHPIGATLTDVRDLAWVDETQVAVLGTTSTSDLTVFLLGVGGQTVPLPSIEGAASIAAGDGPRELYLVTSTGDLYGRSGNGWRQVASEVTALAFAG